MLRSNKTAWWALVLPCLLFLMIFYMVPVAMCLVGSLKTDSGYSLNLYSNLVKDVDFQISALYTLRYTLVSTVLALILSVLVLRALLACTVLFGADRAIKVADAFQLPMLMTYIAAAFLAAMVLQQSGLISSCLHSMGLLEASSEFPELVYDSSGIGVILGYVWKTTPFIVLLTMPAFFKVCRTYLDQAMMVGIGQGQFFRRILLPLIRKNLLIATMVVFAFVFTAFEMPYVLGVTYPKALSVMAWNLFTNGELSDRAVADAIGIVSMTTVIVIVLIGHGLSGGRHEIDGL